ncbi:MAG: type IV secretory system conjugative DNA transfer family protein [Dermatophilaceae bacterium]
MTSSSRTSANLSDKTLAVTVTGTGAVLGCLWAGAWLSSQVSGHGTPKGGLLTPLMALTSASDPSQSWGRPVGPPVLYWGLTIMITMALGGLAVVVATNARRRVSSAKTDPRQLRGLASHRDVDHVAGRKALLARASSLRPSLHNPRVLDVGHWLGRVARIDCYCSVEDSMVLLGPPRSGKGLHFVIPMILDAPGAVITTSTRPDNLTATLAARNRAGPVAVFDPQRLAPGIPSATRWSPIRGCENPQTALVRAKALTAGTASGTTDSSFWQSSAEQAVRCLLHAAALGGRSSTDLYRWSLSAVQAREAVMILSAHTGAALSWHQALESIVTADQKQRDSVWAMVAIAFAALADPRVLDAVSPDDGEAFDPETFLRSRGTVYLLGTSTGAAATAGLVGAFVEDVIEAARRIAAGSPAARLDPPLSLILDEAANYPLPSLSSLMSEGGGTGISTLVVLQSLAQARAVWGEHQAGAIWDSAIVKVILGGGSNARDLDDLSKLIGQRQERQTSTSIGPDGRTTTSTSEREVAVMEPSRLRTLPFGTGVLLLRSALPIVLTLGQWVDRKDSPQLMAERADLERVIQHAHATSR